MLVGKDHYIVHLYNENDFKLLLEAHLNRRKGGRLSTTLLEQCISAYLECKNSMSDSEDLSRMEKLMNHLCIEYKDFRNYAEDEKVVGNPVDAVKVFLELAS